jgi:sulfite reductase beta subunit-like hemoprotein
MFRGDIQLIKVTVKQNFQKRGIETRPASEVHGP